MHPSLRALNRFGLGAQIGERGRVTDPRAWLRTQLEGGPPLLAAPAVADPARMADALRLFRVRARASEQDRRDARQRIVAIAAAESRAALTARAVTERPFVERLVSFWSNHLCVSAGAKAIVAPLAGSYEREAIRPHVLGRFEDMVLASARHPAMLLYLDNAQSIGPRSAAAKIGRGRGPARGLNENYARELLELHTVGVNGGYTQEDVQELAGVLTGWTIAGLQGAGRGRSSANAAGPIRFTFEERLHEPGAKTVMGVRHPESGIEEGERAIRMLCRHKATAAFIASKLVAHVVDDTPPEAAVSRIAQVFHETGGDLRAVSVALIDLPEAWSAGTRKFRTPQDWLAAVLRAFGATDATEAAAPVLRQLRHPLWSPQAPRGFGDAMAEWADPDSLLNRAELSRTIARRLGTAAPDPRLLLDVVDVPAADPLRDLLRDKAVSARDRVALVLAGPAFQWR